jgi:hypothetical protein
MVPIHNAAWARTPVQAHAMARLCGRPGAGRIKKVRALLEMKVLGKVRITSIAAAALLASLAFAGRALAQPPQVERIDGGRVITEVVVNGHLIEGADEAPANELRPVPNWIDGSGALDPARRHSH